MSFTYNLNIPAANNNPSADQPNMRTNTNSINSILNVDHFTFSAGNAGRHKQVTLTNEAAPGFTGGNGALYANLDTGNSWPFWQNALGSFRIMGPQVASPTGYTWLGGILFQWGQITSTSSSFVAQAYPIPFPTATFTILCQPYGSGTPPNGNGNIEIRKSTFSNLNQFQWCYVTNSGEYTGFFWVAIGN